MDLSVGNYEKVTVPLKIYNPKLKFHCISVYFYDYVSLRFHCFIFLKFKMAAMKPEVFISQALKQFRMKCQH